MRRRVRGTGSVFFRKADRLWIAQVSIGSPRRYIVRSARTKDGAKAKLAELRGSLAAGIVPSRMTTSDFLERWVSDVRNIRETTRASYGSVLRMQVYPRIGNVPLTELHPLHIERLLSDVPLSEGSVRNVHKILRRALRDAHRAGLIQRNPASRDFIDAPRYELDEPESLTEAQLDALLAAAEGNDIEALVIVAADTGLRQGELLGLRWEDVNEPADGIRDRRGDRGIRIGRAERGVDQVVGIGSGGSLTVTHELIRGTRTLGEPKTKWSKRTVPLTPRAAAALAEQRERLIAQGFVPTRTGPVFPTSDGGPISGSAVTHRFYRLCDKAGLDRRPFRILRSTYSSRLFEAGVPEATIGRLMGHAPGSRITRRHYISTTGDQAIAAVARLVKETVA